MSESARTKFSSEQWMTVQPDGSVVLDAYAGKTREELKERCHELASAYEDWKFAAMAAATDGDNRIANVREPYRSKIQAMLDAYSDDDREVHYP